jgi:hypothetical protein
MDNLLSIVTFLPLVAALIMAVFLRGDDEAAQLNAKRLAFAATLRPSSCRSSSCAVRPGRHRLPAGGADGVALRPAIQGGRRRDQRAVRDADHVPDADHDRRLLGRDASREGIHDRDAGARDADDRRLRGAGPRAVLPVLRGGPDPDVPDHRHLGRQGPDLRVLQVLPLHLPRLGPDAGRDGGDVCGCGHHGYRALLAHQFSAGDDRPAGLADRGRACRRCCGSPSSRVSR